MKKLSLLFLCTLLCMSLFAQTAFASTGGSGNVDTGGGNMGQGNSKNFWSNGDDGVRVTIVDAESGHATKAPIDFSNRKYNGVLAHFGKVSKLVYRGGTALSLASGVAYFSYQPVNNMPAIIKSGGKNNIEAIKRYFCSEYFCMLMAELTGTDYDQLISGKYRLLLEPISYFTYSGNKYAMTATEVALYDQKANGDLRSKMASMSHQNLPLAMFLERNDLGFTAWTGAKTGRQSNANIISYLGVGIVWFKDVPIKPEGDIDAPDVEYRVNTDVITSVTLTTSSDLTPDNPATVTFYIEGRSYTVNNIVIPAGDSQVVWVKWKTPDNPQKITIQVSVSGAYTAKTALIASIVDLNELIPPDPLATDTSPRYTVPPIPTNPQKTVANWGVWHCYWVPVWVWCSHGEDDGHWIDEGYWEFAYTGYSASLTGGMRLLPDDIVPTAQGKGMKSGYGVKTEVSAALSTTAPEGHFTYTQTAFSVFPEFSYRTYLRLLERTSGGRTAKFSFRENEFSTYNRRAHFLPVWFPDCSQYTVYTQVWDTWTPDGMLSINLNDAVLIDGSLFDDWYTNRA